MHNCSFHELHQLNSDLNLIAVIRLDQNKLITRFISRLETTPFVSNLRHLMLALIIHVQFQKVSKSQTEVRSLKNLIHWEQSGQRRKLPEESAEESLHLGRVYDSNFRITDAIPAFPPSRLLRLISLLTADGESAVNNDHKCLMFSFVKREGKTLVNHPVEFA